MKLRWSVVVVAALAVVGCGKGGKDHSARNLKPQTTGAATSAPALPGGFSTHQGPIDEDFDGLTNDQEAFFGTDPRNPDTDGDGIIDGRDLAPLFGAAGYGPFETTYPTGAVHSQHEYKACGLQGSSKVEKWLFGWKETDKGTKGTRSSELTADALVADLAERAQQSDYAPVSAAPVGQVEDLGSHRFQKTVVYSRYTIDYGFQAQRFNVAFRNRVPTQVRDQGGDAFASRVIPVKVEGGRRSTVIVQFSVDAGADRFADTQTGYTVPAFTYQVFAGTDLLKSAVLLDDVATGAVLNQHAYEVRLPLPEVTGAGAQSWTVVFTPVWVSRQGTGPTSVEAIDAGNLRIGAMAHDMDVVRSSDKAQRLTAIVADAKALSMDLRAQAAQANFQPAPAQQQTIVQKQQGKSGLEWTVSIVSTTAAIARTAVSTLIQVDEYTSFSSGADLAKLMSPEDARRYGSIVEQLQKVENASLAVIHGLQAVVAIQSGDKIRATLYAARSVTEVFRAIGDTELIRAGAGVAAFATDLYEAYDAFRGGDNLRGGMYVLRAGVDLLQAFGDSDTAAAAGAVLGGASSGVAAYQAFNDGDTALGLVHVARGAGAIARYFFQGQSIGGIPAASVITAALGVIDVGYNIYLATRQDDAILKQRFVEDAVAAALDTAIMLIPTVGPVIQAVWRLTWTALTLIFPELAKYRMFRSPGAFLTFVGQVFFTNSIPSAYSEQAYEEAARKLIAKVEELQTQGQSVALLLPKVEQKR